MQKQIPIAALVVNSENYRFDPVDNEAQAINLMISEKGDEIYNLAKHILEFGMDESKAIRSIEENGKYIVLDGNRRITAIKCLRDPALISLPQLRKKFETLSSKFKKKPIEKVNCFVFPTEEDAAEWIRLDHTGKNEGAGQDSWSSAAVNRFDYKQGGILSPAMQAVDLLAKHGVEIEEKKMKKSTIDRIFSNPDARSYLGIDIKDKVLHLTADEEEVVRRIEILFRKIIDDDVKVDRVYTAKKAREFTSELFKDEKPAKRQPKQITKKSGQQTSEIDQQAQKKKVPGKLIKIFIITAFSGLESTIQTIRQVAKEMLKQEKTFTIDHSTGSRASQDAKIEKAIEDADFIVVNLSMGAKERLAYEAIKNAKGGEEILKKFFPINHNVLVELGYALHTRKTAKNKDMFILVKDEHSGDLPTLKKFCKDSFFDIRNRDQVFYKDEADLAAKLKTQFKNCESMKTYLK